MTTSFMKDFLDGEKSPEEKNLLSAQQVERKHDVLRLDPQAVFASEDGEDDDMMGCDIPTGGCGGGCGCRS